MMIARNVSNTELSDTVLNYRTEGYGLINMFASEPIDGSAVLNVIMRKGDSVIRITSDVRDRMFNSISSKNVNAEIYERLILEHNGMEPRGLRNRTPVTYWRSGNPPLSKDRDQSKEETRIKLPHNDIRGDGIFEIPVGPVHAGVIEPGHFRFSVAGESVIKLNVHLGYTHRGVEKLMEGPVTQSRIHLAERIAGDTTVANSLAFSHIMENNCQVPERAEYIRVIAAEIERIYNHLSAIGGMNTDTAFAVLSAKASKLQEDALRIAYRTFGSRYMHNVIVPGGVKKDITSEALGDMERSLILLRLEFDELVSKMEASNSLRDRLVTTGVLEPKIARKFRVLGPIGRASGMYTDVRKERPYDAYRYLGLNVPMESSGDVYARTKVRMKEVHESIDLIFQSIAMMPEGEIKSDVRADDGFRVGIVEAPRGELVHCADIRNGEVWRYSIRDPSLVNWPMMSYAVPGNVVPDFPLINKSFSLAYSGNDL